MLYFLPVFFILYGLTPNKFKNMTLLSGSLIFYAMGEPRHLLLLVVSVLVNYFVGLHLGRESVCDDIDEVYFVKRKSNVWRRVLLVLAVLGNVGMLCFFKVTSQESGLPLGISFYTFQVLSYLFDAYRGSIKRERSLIKVATYITMFPKLASGPIVSYDEVEKELAHREVTMEKLEDGLKVFTIGLSAKVLLADRLGLLWHEVQVTGFESISTPLAWIAALAYSMQIYFDFYGYSLMAVGLGRMLGFELPVNFRTPYMARGVRDFYRRWHVTLGRWFCEYVYIPLGGSRRGELRTMGNLLIVWLLTAVWHGSTLNFGVWGVLLWLCIVMERMVERTGFGKRLKVLPHLYLWCVIPISWMCFVITDLSELQTYLGRMFSLVPAVSARSGDWLAAFQRYGALLVAAMVLCTPFVEKVCRKWKKRLIGKIILATVFWICVWRLMVEGNNPFMYFRF